VDSDRFDRLAKILSTNGTRRRLVRLLPMLPIAGTLVAVLGEESEAGRRKKLKKRHRDHHDRRQGHRKKAKQREQNKRQQQRNKQPETTPPPPVGCTPEPAAMTCAGRCASVRNSCGTVIDCGACRCTPACPLCQTCNTNSGHCVPNGAVEGHECGSGLVCAQGTCRCAAQACFSAGGCCADAVCVPTTFQTDRNNCGGCGTTCTAPANAHDPDCRAGACTFTCDAGWASCDNNATTGCETALGTDTDCSTCGNACVAPETCGAVTPNVCGCKPKTCAADYPGQCGTFAQGCGLPDLTCSCSGTTCCDKGSDQTGTCRALGTNSTCGVGGGNCVACTAPDACGSGGASNVCGPDTAKPTWAVEGTGDEARTTIIQDTGTGLAQIIVTKSENADTVMPPFEPGTTAPIEVRHIRFAQGTVGIEMRVFDLADNVAICEFEF
jgi:hypothetical protein